MNWQLFIDGLAILEVADDDFINAKVTQEVNAAGSFTFTLIPTSSLYNRFVMNKTYVEVMFGTGANTRCIFRGRPTSYKVNFWKEKTITCDGILADLSKTIQRQARYSNKTASSLLKSYLDAHNLMVGYNEFIRGTVTVDASSIYCYTNYNSTMQEIKEDLLDDYGGYLICDYGNTSTLPESSTTIHYLKEPNHTASQKIELGKNLIDFSSNLKASGYYTDIVPLGAITDTQVVDGLDKRIDITSVNSGSDHLTSSAATTYGLNSICVVWDNINTPSTLKSRAQSWLNSVQFNDVVIEAKAVDLGYLENTAPPFKLFDYVRIISEPHGMDKNFILTKITYDLNYPENSIYTFGNKVSKSLTASTNKATLKNKTGIDVALERTTIKRLPYTRRSTASALSVDVYRIGNEVQIHGYATITGAGPKTGFTRIISDLPAPTYELEFPCCSTDHVGAVKITTAGEFQLYMPNIVSGEIVRFMATYLINM